MSISNRFPIILAVVLAALWAGPARGQGPATQKVRLTRLAPLAAPTTSFGAAVANGSLYVYGGHLGAPHKYSADQQSNQLLRLNLADPGAWEVVGEGPRRTGLAMVAYDGRLYRIGGWVARNAAGSEWDLYSQRDFARFDPKTGQWQELEPLPTGRSSHDAAVLGSRVYVIGGWELSGPGDGQWHQTAYVCDLDQEKPTWREIAQPPFARRALAVAAFRGRIFAIGGMNDSGETTTVTNIYDPESNVWTDGPALPGKDFDGFGASAFGTRDGLFATTGPGTIFRLSDDGQAWQEVGKLAHPRMFHRLVAADGERLVAVGGTSRGGKVKEVESLEVSAFGH